MKRIIIICVSLFCLALVICIVLGISHSSSVFHHNASKLTEEYTGEYDYFYHSRKMQKDVQESPTEFVTPDDLTKIEENTFGNYNELRKIYISRNIRNIDAKAFIHCNNLDSIIVDSRNKYYISRGNCLIEKSTNTLVVGCKNSIIPKGVTTIGKYAFSGCRGLKNIKIPEGVTTIQSSCFDRCKNLASIKIPKSVERIDSGNVFSQCVNLKSITVDKDNQFYDSRDNCNAVIYKNSNRLLFGCCNTYIPDTVTAIDNNAFYACRNLKSINIPASVTSIGYYAFNHCFDLTDVYYSGSQNQWNQIPAALDYYTNFSTNTSLDAATIHFNSQKNKTGDVNLDGRVNINDATYIQYYLASIRPLSNEQLELADIDFSEIVDIKDVTRMQKNLAYIL